MTGRNQGNKHTFRRAYFMQKLAALYGHLLCRFGVHDFRVIDRAFEFGAGGGIEKVQCKRCGTIIARQA